MDAAAEKAALRVEYRRRLAALDAAERSRQSAELAVLLESWAEQRGFETLLATLPLPDEPDLTALLQRWLDRGRSVGLARTGPRRHLEFALVAGLEGPWERRPGGLREPNQEAVLWTPGRPALCLVPGLAFGVTEKPSVIRLGRGGGYFDRWLAGVGASVFAMGTGFSNQVAPRLPTEAHDQPLQGLAVPGQIYGWPEQEG